KSTTFLDKLVMPRAVCWRSDGVLVCESGNGGTGKIWFCKDTDGDLKADEKTLVFEYGAGNPEHTLNGLVPMLDNWIYCAHEGVRLRRTGDQWIREPVAAKGQWGIAQDNVGRLYYTVNDQLIRGDLVPCYFPNAQVPSPV